MRFARTSFQIFLLAFAILLLQVSMARAADDNRQPPEISARVGTAISKLGPLISGKQYAEILAVIEPLLSEDIGDYDRAVLLQIRAQVFLNQGNFADAIAPMEQSLELSDNNGFFDASLTREFLYFLCQLYYQQSVEVSTLAERQAAMQKSYDYLQRWLAALQAPTEDNYIFASSLIYTQATLDPENPDTTKLSEAEELARKGLHSAIRPKEQLYMLLLAIEQIRGNWQPIAKTLELLVSKNPGNATYWQQLLGVYLTLAGQEKNPEAAFQYSVRAILTIERAQAQGFMQESRDHFNLIGLYLNLQRFAEAAERLQSGLDSGKIESERKNWELLASAWQQVRQEEKAIGALQQAITHFPQEGQLEHQLAHIHYAREESDLARTHLQRAIEKGNLDNPGQTCLFLAFLDYDAEQFDAATAWLKQARQHPDASAVEIERLEGAIADAQKTFAQKSPQTSPAPATGTATTNSEKISQ